MERRVAARLSAAEGRRFAWSVGAAFVGLTALALWRGHNSLAWVLGSLGIGLLLAGAMVPGRLGPVNRAWMAFAYALSRVTTPTLMSVVYFLLITPMGIGLRRLSRNPVVRQETGSGFWIRRSSPRSDLRRQF